MPGCEVVVGVVEALHQPGNRHLQEGRLSLGARREAINAALSPDIQPKSSLFPRPRAKRIIHRGDRRFDDLVVVFR